MHESYIHEYMNLIFEFFIFRLSVLHDAFFLYLKCHVARFMDAVSLKEFFFIQEVEDWN